MAVSAAFYFWVNDLTLVGYWMPLLLETHQPRTLIYPGTYGTLGHSLPGAIGAKLACPKQPVVSISGDGGFLFPMHELATARAENLDLIVLVFNDNPFAFRTYQDRMFGGRHIGSAYRSWQESPQSGLSGAFMRCETSFSFPAAVPTDSLDPDQTAAGRGALGLGRGASSAVCGGWGCAIECAFGPERNRGRTKRAMRLSK